MTVAVTKTETTQTGVKKFEETTKDKIIAKIEAQIDAGDLMIPPNYSWKNAVQSAWLHLLEVVDRNNKPALDVCTQASVATAFLDMVQRGLSVVKKQGYFVVYGNKLSFDDSYFGAITIAKRDCDVKDSKAVIVYKGDIFEYEIDVTTARKRVSKHEQKLENINPNNIVGGYAVTTFNDGTYDTEIMTMDQIRTSWMMGGSKGQSPAHKNFPDRMAGKTIINRALTILNASADDSALMGDGDTNIENIRNKITSSANKKPITFEDATYEEVPNKEDVENGPTAQATELTEPVEGAASRELSAELDRKAKDQEELKF